jgi:hypothetical protein
MELKLFTVELFFVLFTNILYSEDKISNDIRIETTVINPQTPFVIGDRIELNYHLIYASNLKLIEPDILNWFDDFEILDYFIDTSRSNFRITLISFEFGDFEIPLLTFNFEDTITNKIYTKVSDCISIKIDNIFLEENPNLKEIQTKNLQEYELNYIMLFGLILFIAVFSFLLSKIIRSRKIQ